MGSKGHGLGLVDFDLFCFSAFQGSLLVIVIMIDGSQNVRWLLNFRVCVFLKSTLIIKLLL